MKSKVILSLCALLLSSCATTRKDFKIANVKSTDGTVVGQVKILYNKRPINQDCSVCFNSVNGPCQKLLADGIVVISLPQGPATLSRIACVDVSMQHHNISNTSFQVKPGLNYIGDITIEWQNEGGYKLSTAFGAIGELIGESKNDGLVKITSNDVDPKLTLTEYETLTKQKPTVLQKSILKVSK